jgi:nicotinamidase-related amidase
MRDIELLNPKRLAVVLVDLQRGYCDPNSDAAQKLKWDVSDADRICRAHVPFLKSLRKILPPEKIIWLRMEEAPETYAPNTSYGPHCAKDFVSLCVRGTAGHDYHMVHPGPNEPQFLKFHFSGFNNKDFGSHLEKTGVTQLAFTGVVSSRCVNATVVTASALGYECLLIKDLISGPKSLQLEMAEHEKMTTFFYAQSISADKFLSELTTKDSKCS